MGQLAGWKCHKIVKAGKITGLSTDPRLAVSVEDCDGATCDVGMPNGWSARGMPAIGDYIVIYDDGYKSWSPAASFEGGYTRLNSNEATDAKENGFVAEIDGQALPA